MATIRRYRVLWGGLSGLPGYSLFYATSAAALGSDLVTFFNAIKGQFSQDLQWDIPISGDTLDDASGHINGTWTDTGGGVVATTGRAPYAAGVGAFSIWRTSAIVGGRRLQGRTFLCPLIAAVYDNSGTLASGTVTTLGGASSTLAAAGKMVVWHRPAKGTFSGGSSALVVSGSVPDQVTSLRSRRK